MLRQLCWNWQGVLQQIFSPAYFSICALVRLGSVGPPDLVASTAGAGPGGLEAPPNLPPCIALDSASGSLILRRFVLDFFSKHDFINLAASLALYSRKC